MGDCPLGSTIQLKVRSLYATVTSICKIHGPGNLGVDVGVVFFLVIPSIPFDELVLPVPSTLGYVGLEVLVLR